ncbi:MAG: glycoside hydrolase [Armatimonadetes bacterium]|nr:glycoside hydrolase [Armatimonadota bacterium]
MYECFPDVVSSHGGRIIVVYRESDGHVAADFTHIVWRVSEDFGHTWSGARYVAQSRRRGRFLEKWNCPRVSRLRDGRLALVCDLYPQPPGERFGRQPPVVYLWLSSDGGESWQGPRPTPVQGIVPDKLVELSDGSWLLTAHRGFPPEWRLIQRLWCSTDSGQTWHGPFTAASQEDLNLCEASVIEAPSGTLVAYMRENSGRGWPIFKAFSYNHGETWNGVYPTLMHGGHRPTAGLLPSGNVLITYRYYPRPGTRNVNTFACLQPLDSALEPDRARQSASILPLDHDRWPNADSGYTGWTILPDGNTIFVVNYIVDDAPAAQIRGYWITEDMFCIP